MILGCEAAEKHFNTKNVLTTVSDKVCNHDNFRIYTLDLYSRLSQNEDEHSVGTQLSLCSAFSFSVQFPTLARDHS